MACEEVKTAKYQTRKSPPFHAKDCKDLTKKGKDGVYVSKPDAKGIYKWTKATAATKTGKTRKAGGKSYLVHDNGSRPFKVNVNGKTVEIYKGEFRKLADGKTIDYNNMDYTKLIKKLTVKEIHVGKSPCIPSADGCGAFGNGNTILLHVSGNTYIYIGSQIYQFTMEDELKAYYSMIGNNDVPYPIILGSKYVYMMINRIYLPRGVFQAKMGPKEWADAHSFYSGYKNPETGEEIVCDDKATKDRKKCEKERTAEGEKLRAKYEKKLKGLKMIQKREI